MTEEEDSINWDDPVDVQLPRAVLMELAAALEETSTGELVLFMPAMNGRYDQFLIVPHGLGELARRVLMRGLIDEVDGRPGVWLERTAFDEETEKLRKEQDEH